MKNILSSMKRERGTLYSLVTRYYLFFAAAVLLLAFLVVEITDDFLTRTNVTIDANRIISNRDLLLSEKYDKLNISRNVGENSYFEILDDKAQVIYSSDKSKTKKYSREELELIPDILGNTYYYIDSVLGNNGETTGYVLQKYSTVFAKDGEQFGTIGVAVLDENRNVVYSDSGINLKHISDKEFEILYENGGDTYLQKYEFTTNDEQERTMLIHQDFNYTSLNNAYRKIYTTAILVFLLILAAFVVFFVFNTALAVRRPINMLEDAMTDLGSGNKDVAISYSGPKEFVHIVDSFNDMAGKLSNAEKEKQKLEEERQKMLADISHDLKTPITVIQGYAKAVADGMVPENEQKKYLDTISSKADILSELINTFYEYSKLEHPEFQLYKKECDICEYFREYLAAKYDELDIAGYEMKIDIPEEKILKPIDEAQLKRVFENIIANSVKSNPKGTLICAEMKKVREKVVIHLGDNGVGVPVSIRGEIFKPFIVGDDARTSGKGTGLGLSIAKLIVEAHGGTIRLMDENESDYSTMFEIVL
ncbi:ATP-binding protein [Butyrivibrio sp. JL13D10]|uniref:HAMP domain-containing sensor histidine kinase n=1 Tax=Butyrivibrio sp. JL13D10 TaxID=3236815 RepID=UPI0038B60C42